ncbi:MAG: glycosyltransferase [Ignisphaera sp.]
MKILVITPIGYGSARSGGAEVYIFELAKRITSKTDVDITILTSDRDIKHVKSREQRLRIESISQGFFTFPLLLLFHIRQRIREADVVVENISKFPLIVPAIISRITKRPFVAIVHHIHGKTLFMELPTALATLFFFYEYISLFIYALLRVPVITVSRTSEAELRKLGFKNIYVVYPGLTSPISNDDNTFRKSRRPLLVYVNRVRKYKRLDHFVKACKHVIEEIPDAICLIVGKGDEKLGANLKRLASRLGVEKQVKIFVSNVSNDLRYKILGKAWVNVFTSAKEGFGIGVLETLSQGVPVVAYDIPAMRELLAGYDSSVLVKNGDIKHLAEQCIKILKSTKALLDISSEARRFVKVRGKIYSFDVSAIKFLNAIATYLKSERKDQRKA